MHISRLVEARAGVAESRSEEQTHPERERVFLSFRVRHL